jgi:hypothetical protein
MLLIAETDAEVALLISRYAAISYALGRRVPLKVQSPTGQILPVLPQGTPAAQGASLNNPNLVCTF